MIRPAKLSDLPQLMSLCRLYYCEGNAPRLEMDEEKLRRGLYHAIISDDMDMSVLEKDGDVIGYTHSYITDTLFSYDVVIDTDLLYLHPDHRKGHNGAKLIKNLKKIAKKKGAKYVYLGITSEIQEQRTAQLYGKLGYRRIGQDFRLEV